MSNSQQLKPQRWPLRFEAVEPFWRDNFWKNCISCVPCWDNNSGTILGTGSLAPEQYSGKFSGIIASPASYLGHGGGGSDPSWITGDEGPRIKFSTPASNGGIYSLVKGGSGVGDVISSDKVTILKVRRLLTSVITNGTSCGNASSRSAGGPGCDAMMPANDGSIRFFFGVNGDGTNGPLNIAGPKVVILPAVYTPSTNVEAWTFTAGPSGLKVYLDGKFLGGNTNLASRTLNSTSTGTGPTLTQALQFGGGDPSDGEEVIFWAVIDEEWQPGMINTWLQDIFAPIRRAALMGLPPIPPPPPPPPPPPAGGSRILDFQGSRTASRKLVFRG